ncbi:hypothetical protein ACFL5Z_07245 [Planctomycetota bacterium]
MRKRDNTMDFNTQNKGKRTDSKLYKAAAGSTSFRGLGLLWIVVIGATLFLSAGSALGQYGSFTITPMKVEAQITPGKTIQTVLNIQNLDPNSAHTIDLSLVELSQSVRGNWMIVDPNDPNSFTDPDAPTFGFDMRRLSSCRTWIRLKNNSVTLQPSQYAPVELSIKVGRGQRGFHTAGILATVQPRPGMTDIALSVRFLVPVVVEVETRPIPAKIQATDVGLEFVPAGAAAPATTLVTMDVYNSGGTLSRLKPIARIYAFSKNHWHLVTTTEFSEKRIIPGAILRLKADVRKSLPTGQYKIQGELYVDGRRTKRIEKIFDFQGDPTINRLAADAPLDINPLDLIIECAPGSLRAETITVYNASDETINIQTAIGLQPKLQQKVLENVRGVDLDCTTWLKITPENFTLTGGGGRKKVQVVANLPVNAVHPCYYSLLALWATYPDGQRAGYRTANIFIKNNHIAAEPAARGLNVRLQALDESKYLVTATFRNLKTIHFKPLSVKAGVVPTTGQGALTVPRLSTYMSGDPSPMLPAEDRTFTADLDFATIPAGRYLLIGRLEYAPGQIEYAERLIDVSIQGDRRIVQTVGTNLELGEAVEVNW